MALARRVCDVDRIDRTAPGDRSSVRGNPHHSDEFPSDDGGYETTVRSRFLQSRWAERSRLFPGHRRTNVHLIPRRISKPVGHDESILQLDVFLRHRRIPRGHRRFGWAADRAAGLYGRVAQAECRWAPPFLKRGTEKGDSRPPVNAVRDTVASVGHQHIPYSGSGLSLLQNSTMRSFKIEGHCSAHLQMGVLTGIVANIADQEIGATKVDPRLLQEARLSERPIWYPLARI
jgi:hypothetical protein